MDSSNKTKPFNNHSVDFDRRKASSQMVRFPLIDSDGMEISKNRRLDASIYLCKMELRELRLQENEFEQLFKK